MDHVEFLDGDIAVTMEELRNFLKLQNDRNVKVEEMMKNKFWKELSTPYSL